MACRGLDYEHLGGDFNADETLILLKEVLSESHKAAPATYDNNKQLPLHCAVDSFVTSLVTEKKMFTVPDAKTKATVQKNCHAHVKLAIECLSELLRANSSATFCRDGKTGLFPFMQAGVKRDGVEEGDAAVERDHISIVYFLLREDPSVIRIAGET